MAHVYMTPSEVARHNHKDDCWVIVFDKVVDITSVISSAPFDKAAPLLANAGGNVSHWFKRAGDGSVTVKTRVDPISNIVVPYAPEGTFVDVPDMSPSTSNVLVEVPWWQDDKLVVGRLTGLTRLIKVVNTLTGQEDIVEFANEDTVADMQKKYLTHNAHCTSYTWKSLRDGLFKVLDSSKTLEQNGIPDDGEELVRLGLEPSDPGNLTTIMLFFNDDLTVA